ncbi:jg7477 [Pararge aegeria aegeria]|uniref:Jg7477 protein n=1 Tax=Pararge aegeria aegeria TaxID=348720 RepID=A0A8S4R999_9NEOP|nr:jg7477 [Pararge aegeria aegeria]
MTLFLSPRSIAVFQSEGRGIRCNCRQVMKLEIRVGDPSRSHRKEGRGFTPTPQVYGQGAFAGRLVSKMLFCLWAMSMCTWARFSVKYRCKTNQVARMRSGSAF